MSNEQNPFKSPSEDEGLPKYVPSTDPSIEHEPNRLDAEFLPEEAEEMAAAPLRSSDDVEVEHTVWDEPGLSSNLAGPAPKEAITFDRWLKKKIAETPEGSTWLIAVCIGVLSGILALPGTMFLGFQFGNNPVSAFVFEPLAEEIVKLGLAIWIVEKRPYLFKFAIQIVIACVCSGCVFSVIESLVNSQLKTRNAPWLASGQLLVFRMTLHVVSSLLASFGLIRVWRHCIETATKPQLSRGGAFIVMAVAIHVIFNFVLLAVYAQ